VNKYYNQHFTLAERLDPEKSMAICRLYLTHWGQHYENMTGKKATVEVFAAIWCSGPTGYKKMDKLNVKKYIEKVKKELAKK
jgi:hypothetical protein